MFPLKHNDTRLPSKTLVIGIRIKGEAKAYPIEEIKNTPLKDTVGAINIKIFAGPGDTAYITDEKGDLLPAVIMYWFAWSSFNKDTLIYGR
jgi:hypothetical protein